MALEISGDLALQAKYAPLSAFSERVLAFVPIAAADGPAIGRNFTSPIRVVKRQHFERVRPCGALVGSASSNEPDGAGFIRRGHPSLVVEMATKYKIRPLGNLVF